MTYDTNTEIDRTRRYYARAKATTQAEILNLEYELTRLDKCQATEIAMLEKTRRKNRT